MRKDVAFTNKTGENQHAASVVATFATLPQNRIVHTRLTEDEFTSVNSSNQFIESIHRINLSHQFITPIYCTTISTRRFIARPSSVLLVAIGAKLAMPLGMRRRLSIPA